MKKSLSFLTKYFFPCFSVFFFHRTEMSSGPFQTVTRYQCCRLRTYFGPLPSYLPSFRQLCQTIPTNCKMNYGAWIFFLARDQNTRSGLVFFSRSRRKGSVTRFSACIPSSQSQFFNFPCFAQAGRISVSPVGYCC